MPLHDVVIFRSIQKHLAVPIYKVAGCFQNRVHSRMRKIEFGHGQSFSVQRHFAEELGNVFRWRQLGRGSIRIENRDQFQKPPFRQT